MAEAFRVPIIKLHGVLLVPIQGALTDRLVVQLKDDVAERVKQTGACGLVIDLSGVDVIDSYLSRAIHSMASIAGLMGARTVISGIAPMMALTLVEMGLSLGKTMTRPTLEEAIELLRSCDVGAGDDDADNSADVLYGGGDDDA